MSSARAARELITAPNIHYVAPHPARRSTYRFSGGRSAARCGRVASVRSPAACFALVERRAGRNLAPLAECLLASPDGDHPRLGAPDDGQPLLQLHLHPPRRHAGQLRPGRDPAAVGTSPGGPAASSTRCSPSARASPGTIHERCWCRCSPGRGDSRTRRNGWQARWLQYLPSWLMMPDKKAMEGYYVGNSTLYTPVEHLMAWARRC